MASVEARAVLELVVGNRVERINRIHYVYLGEVNEQVGAVELVIGKLVDSVELALNVRGKAIGATFRSSSQILRVDAEADDLYVQLT